MSTLLWKPTLAAALPADHDLTTMPYPLLASPKLDGVRAMVQRGVLVSRNGRPISSLQAQKKFGRAEYEGLDGEITVGAPYGQDVFNKTVRATQRRDADAEDLRFNVFDRKEIELSFIGRSVELRRLVGEQNGVYLVKQALIHDAAQLQAYLAAQLAKGYEGCMLRRADAGPYMQKRSTLKEFSLVKFKPWEFGEASVEGAYLLRHNDNTEKTSTGRRTTAKAGIRLDKTQYGSALLRDVKTKVEFTVNIPTDNLRCWAGWAEPKRWLGKRVRYKFQLCGTLKGGAPRFPTATFQDLMP